MLVNFHYSSLVTTSVAVVWSCPAVALLEKLVEHEWQKRVGRHADSKALVHQKLAIGKWKEREEKKKKSAPEKIVTTFRS